MLKEKDAFGSAIRDFHEGKADHYFVEREDGYLFQESLKMYFAEYPDWADLEQRMTKHVGGRILDIGCGAGRHALYLQARNFDVTAIDKSPIAIETAKKRGVKEAHAVSIEAFIKSPSFGLFDTIIMMGHNLGLLRSFEEGRALLSALYKVTAADAQIIGTNRDPFKTVGEDHLEYCASNRLKGRMFGQMRFRSRHRNILGDWFDYLFLSEEELKKICEGTGWHLEATTYGDGGFGRQSYLAILRKV